MNYMNIININSFLLAEKFKRFKNMHKFAV